MNPSDRWRRLLAEGIVIVGSILFAFGIQAWWDSRGEAIQSDALLSALAEDFTAAAEQFATAQRANEAALTSSEALLHWVEAGAVPSVQRAQADSAFSRLFYSMDTFNPPMGTVETILSSGRLDLFEDPNLARELTRWTSAIANYKEWEAAGSDHFYRVLYPRLAAAASLQDLDISVPWEVPWPHNRTEITALVGNAEFGSNLYMHYVLFYNLRSVSPQVEESIARILEITERMQDE